MSDESDANRPRSYDVLVIGAGAAGMWTALMAAEHGAHVCLLSRKPLHESASFHAQGGLAAALEPGDSPEQHAADTLAAGRGMCSPEAVRTLTSEAPDAVAQLIEIGVEFDRRDNGALAMGLEGGHTRRRIVHSGGSKTGEVITGRLAELVRQNSSIHLLEGHSATGLISDGSRCYGTATDNGRLLANATVLATGGAAALWSRTTNPRGAIGAGAVLGAQAGAELVDLEFCQFHPTATFLPGQAADGMLITEAIRGEGATLLDAGGARFTDELAARDAVTAAIIDRTRVEQTSSVGLDMRAVDPDRFPAMFDALESAGLDPRRSPVPVAPAAHYTMGGIAVDSDGRSSLAGLYAVGETACTGLHGANRLASNSLTECFVFGRRSAVAACSEIAPKIAPNDPAWEFEPPADATREEVWSLAGPLRDAERLSQLRTVIYPLARLIAESAFERRESRGGHRRTDFPALDPALDGCRLFRTWAGSAQWRSWDESGT